MAHRVSFSSRKSLQRTERPAQPSAPRGVHFIDTDELIGSRSEGIDSVTVQPRSNGGAQRRRYLSVQPDHVPSLQTQKPPARKSVKISQETQNPGMIFVGEDSVPLRSSMRREKPPPDRHVRLETKTRKSPEIHEPTSEKPENSDRTQRRATLKDFPSLMELLSRKKKSSE